MTPIIIPAIRNINALSSIESRNCIYKSTVKHIIAATNHKPCKQEFTKMHKYSLLLRTPTVPPFIS